MLASQLCDSNATSLVATVARPGGSPRSPVLAACCELQMLALVAADRGSKSRRAGSQTRRTRSRCRSESTVWTLGTRCWCALKPWHECASSLVLHFSRPAPLPESLSLLPELPPVRPAPSAPCSLTWLQHDLQNPAPASLVVGAADRQTSDFHPVSTIDSDRSQLLVILGRVVTVSQSLCGRWWGQRTDRSASSTWRRRRRRTSSCRAHSSSRRGAQGLPQSFPDPRGCKPESLERIPSAATPCSWAVHAVSGRCAQTQCVAPM